MPKRGRGRPRGSKNKVRRVEAAEARSCSPIRQPGCDAAVDVSQYRADKRAERFVLQMLSDPVQRSKLEKLDGMKVTCACLCAGADFYRDYHGEIEKMLLAHAGLRMELDFVLACEKSECCIKAIQLRWPNCVIVKHLKHLTDKLAWDETSQRWINVPKAQLVLSGIWCGCLSSLNNKRSENKKTFSTEGMSSAGDEPKTFDTFIQTFAYVLAAGSIIWVIECTLGFVEGVPPVHLTFRFA